MAPFEQAVLIRRHRIRSPSYRYLLTQIAPRLCNRAITAILRLIITRPLYERQRILRRAMQRADRLDIASDPIRAAAGSLGVALRALTEMLQEIHYKIDGDSRLCKRSSRWQK